MKISFSHSAIIALFAFSSIWAEVRIMLTAALTDDHFEFRKNQYIESLNILTSYGYKNPYIVEAIKKTGPTFLDEYSTNVFYATCNNPSLRNHGANEARTLLEAFEHFQFADDDIILKMTGRYQLISDHLLKILEAKQNDFDAFIFTRPGHAVSFVGFAMRCAHFKEMLKILPYNLLEQNINWLSLEGAIDFHIEDKIAEGSLKIFYLDKLDIRAELFGSSTVPNHRKQTNIY